MREITMAPAGSFQRADNMRSDVYFRFDLKPCFKDIVLKLGRGGRGPEIGIKQIAAGAENAMHGSEE